MKTRTAELRSTSGVPLHLTTWEPEGTPRAALVVVHGLGEHAGRYEHLAQHFTGQGFMVYGPDHLGFGRSGGKPGDTSVGQMAGDVVALCGHIDEEVGPRVRRIMVGHSMGGLVSLVAMRDHPGRFSEAVVLGPSLNVTRGINGMLVGLSRALGVLLPSMTLRSGLKPDDLCSVPEVVEAYKADPLVHDRISSRLFNSMVDEGRRLRDAPGSLPLEAGLLFMHGRQDPICYADDTEAYFQSLAIERRALKIWPGMKHEILNETERDEVLDEIDRFLGLS